MINIWKSTIKTLECSRVFFWTPSAGVKNTLQTCLGDLRLSPALNAEMILHPCALMKTGFIFKLRATTLSYDLQLSSIRMKSLMPKFSRKTPENEVVLNRNEMSALSSPWKVGK